LLVRPASSAACRCIGDISRATQMFKKLHACWCVRLNINHKHAAAATASLPNHVAPPKLSEQASSRTQQHLP
jgi:hypothetical protein